jgi:hypothetical protein
MLTRHREYDRKRAIYFKIGYCNYWKKPIHRTSHLGLRISMPYHRFLNLRELFQGDLNAKLTKNVISKDFQTLNCNCRDKDACLYKEDAVNRL